MRGGCRVTRAGAIVAFAVALLVSSASASAAAAAGRIDSIDRAAGTVTFLQTPDANIPIRAHVGSGFLVASEANGGRRFLVTAAHVARNFSDATTVTVGD